MAIAESALKPIDPKALTVKLAQTVELWGTPPNWQHIAGFYLEALEPCAEDLVDDVLKQARLTFKWLPKPSELWALANQEMIRRQVALNVARDAVKNWRDDLPSEVDINERKRVGALMGQLREQLRTDEAKASGDRGDWQKRARWTRMGDPEL